MRYYKIKIEGQTIFESVVNGQNDPGALDIEFQLAVAHKQVIAGAGGYLKVWGIPISFIADAKKLFGKNIEVYGGMTEGLPLATFQVPHQGLLCSGTIQPAFGNWIGTEILINFNIVSGGHSTEDMGGPNNPKNIIHNWPANSPLSQALENTLKIAFPNMKRNIQISDKLKLPYDDLGFYNSIDQFMNYINAISMSILGKNKGYTGVKTYVKNNTIHIKDNDKKDTTGIIKIDYRDLIGQPTWQGPNIIQVSTILRSDIDQETKFSLPPGLITMSSGGAYSVQANLIGQGGNVADTNQTFTTTLVTHYGKFRQNDSSSWKTVIDANISS